MTITKIDAKTALVVVDMQNSILRYDFVNPINDVTQRICKLYEAFRSHDLPVVFVIGNGFVLGRCDRPRNPGPFAPDAFELLPEIKEREGDYLINKQAWSAFSNPELKRIMSAQEVTQMVIAGVATSISVESTARHAFDLGYNVTVATDAVSDLDEENHTHSLTRILPKLSECGTTREIISVLKSM